MHKALLLSTAPASVELEPEPIPARWILSGTPNARGKRLVQSGDWTSSVVVWDCTAGVFKWHYSKDEVIVVSSGEAFLIGEDGSERRFGPGDVGYFSAGTTCTWRVDEYIRKVAVLRETLWRPFGVSLRVWNKLLRVVGMKGPSPL